MTGKISRGQRFVRSSAHTKKRTNADCEECLFCYRDGKSRCANRRIRIRQDDYLSGMYGVCPPRLRYYRWKREAPR